MSRLRLSLIKPEWSYSTKDVPHARSVFAVFICFNIIIMDIADKPGSPHCLLRIYVLMPNVI